MHTETINLESVLHLLANSRFVNNDSRLMKEEHLVITVTVAAGKIITYVDSSVHRTPQ